MNLFKPSFLGLGSVKFGRNLGVKYPTSFTIPTHKELTSLLDKAYDLGINFIDTAPAYGTSEEKLGLLLQGQRHKWLVATKAGEDFRDGKSYFDFTPVAITTSVHSSLKRLQTDYLDLVLIHSDGNDVAIINQYEVFDTLQSLQRQGLIKHIGMSTKTAAGSLLSLQHSDGIMIEYNLAQNAATLKQQQVIIDTAAQKNKFVLIKKSFNSGHVCRDKNSVEDTFALMATTQKITQGITSVIIGTINFTHLEQNARLAKQFNLNSI